MKKTMYQILCVFFLFCNTLTLAQDILGHEREIAHSEKYNLREIEFENEEEKFTLSGTLITPKSDFDKVVVIVPGTGKDGRNSHYKLVDSLLNHNIAVYRYDERGVGKSGGRYFNLYLFSSIRNFNDLYYCISTLRKQVSLQGKKIGVMGHSEGGLASLEAIEKGAIIDFLIHWATPIKPREMVKYQHETEPNLLFFETLKMDQNERNRFIDLVNDVVQNNNHLKNDKLRKTIDQRAKALGYKKNDYKSYISNTLFLTFLKKDYETTYKNINSPVLYILGSLDELVDPIRNTELLTKIDNENIDIEVVDGLYHMFLGKKVSEPVPGIYNIDDEALDKILKWIVRV